MAKLRDFPRISEAAEYLGISPNTLRDRERTGKILARRHPVNRSRLSASMISIPSWARSIGTPPRISFKSQSL
jgi:predicted site-specific integrase-resolvase